MLVPEIFSNCHAKAFFRTRQDSREHPSKGYLPTASFQKIIGMPDNYIPFRRTNPSI